MSAVLHFAHFSDYFVFADMFLENIKFKQNSLTKIKQTGRQAGGHGKTNI
jgi:hypothetical protein